MSMVPKMETYQLSHVEDTCVDSVGVSVQLTMWWRHSHHVDLDPN